MYANQSHEASTAALEEAIRSFPAVVPLLADKLDIPLSAHIRGMPCFRIQTDSKYIPFFQLFSTQSSPAALAN